MLFSDFRSTPRKVLAVTVTFLLAAAVATRPAQAKTKFKVLHTFDGKDGAAPVGQLVRDKDGNLYGTTVLGGTGKCVGGCGTAFKMNSSGKMIWLHSFNGTQGGRQPQAGLLRDAAGNLFGTTVFGGSRANNHYCYPLGCGVVFKLDKTGRETVLYKFKGFPDGYLPQPLLVEDSAGNLYGTTSIGGNNESGTVFEIDTAGKETILYNFNGGADGCGPDPGVIFDPSGNLYGVAGGGSGGCNGYGVVFKVDTAGNETVLHTFDGADGSAPDSVLLFDSQGNLYGTTALGGSSANCHYEGGCGTIFELSPQNESWSETVLYNLCSLSDCSDGLEPLRGPLVRDSTNGNLYGTAYFGGAYRNCNGEGCGVVFKLDTSGNETVLHNFTGGADGASPWGGLTAGSTGSMYGAAQQGGDQCKAGNGQGCGTVFKITP